MEKIKASVLLIDDQEDMLAFCQSVLAGIVTEVTAVSSSKAARAAFHAKTFDLVLTDISIDDDGNGIGLAQEIKNVSPGTGVVIMTATPSIATAIGGLKTGAVEYLIKPFSPVYLESVIRNTFEKAKLSSELERAKAVKAELDAAYTQLRASERVKDAFLSRLNHELRTPLAIAIASSELMGQHLQGRKDAEVWARSDAALKNLHLIIEELLLFSDLLKDSLELKKTKSDLWPLLETVVRDLKFLYEEMGIKVDLSREGEDYPLFADPEMMRVVFTQLLTNAVKFNRRGGTITVKAAYLPERAAFRFTNTGCGVGEEAMPHLFDGFFQAADYLTRAVGGLGLGLATVKRIVDAHSGYVTASRNQTGDGMIFAVSLPRKAKTES